MDEVTTDAMRSLLGSLSNADIAVRPFVDDGLELTDTRRPVVGTYLDELIEAAQRVKDALDAAPNAPSGSSVVAFARRHLTGVSVGA